MNLFVLFPINLSVFQLVSVVTWRTLLDTDHFSKFLRIFSLQF